MGDFAIRTERDKNQAISIIASLSPPFFLRANKKIPPNRAKFQLQFHWYAELAKQGICSADEYEAYCKLHFGVPILRARNDDFKDCYDEHILPLPYKTKLALVGSPFNLKVTEKMNGKELSLYLDAIKNHFGKQGYALSNGKEPSWWI